MKINATVLELVFTAVFIACAALLWIDLHSIGATVHLNDEVLKQRDFIAVVNSRLEAQTTNRLKK